MKQRYVALLRGINVGGHKKVPMAKLKEMMLISLGYEKVQTLLNSGNVVFSAATTSEKTLEKDIGLALEKTFGFSVSIIVREASSIQNLIKNNPFSATEVHKDIRLYITFLKDPVQNIGLDIPWISDDGAYQIINFTGKEVISFLDVSKKKTTDAMKIVEINFGKNVTTRNWNTIIKLEKFF